MLDIILDKDNLCSGLQVQFYRGRQTAFRKLALDIAPEECWLSWQELELVLVDEIHGVTAGGEGDGKLGITLVELGTHPLVEQLKVLTLRLTGSDMVEDADEDRVALAINFLEFDADELELLEDLGIEEEAAAIERIQQFAVLLLHHRFQLIDVAHQQKLLSSERLPHIAAIHTQHLVDEIDDVGTHHTDLIDDDEFHFTDNLDFSELYFNVFRMLRTEYILSLGSRGWKGSLKKLCRVLPPALMAAMPVGARTMCFFLVLAAMYRRKVDLPVPAFPVRKSERRVNCMIWSAFCSSALSRSIIFYF